MSDVLSVLIVGCGDIAGGFDTAHQGPEVLTHARAYGRQGNFTLTACVEPDEERRLAFMERWNVPHGFADLEACRASGMAFDVASLCAPTPFHEDALERLLQMPMRAVFCEKPLTADLAPARRLVAAYEAAGRPLAVNFLRRGDRALNDLRRDIADGKWGALQSAVGHYTKGILNCGSHMIDLVHFLAGPLTPEAVFRRRLDFTPDDPTLDALLSTAEGAPMYLVGSHSRHFFSFELDLTLEGGRVVIEDLGRTLRHRRVVTHPVFPSRRSLDRGDWTETGFAEAMVRIVDNLQAHLADATPLLSDGRNALAAQELCATLIDMAGGME
jgi:predicted dehydrogenase